MEIRPLSFLWTIWFTFGQTPAFLFSMTLATNNGRRVAVGMIMTSYTIVQVISYFQRKSWIDSLCMVLFYTWASVIFLHGATQGNVGACTFCFYLIPLGYVLTLENQTKYQNEKASAQFGPVSIVFVKAARIWKILQIVYSAIMFIPASHSLLSMVMLVANGIKYRF